MHFAHVGDCVMLIEAALFHAVPGIGTFLLLALLNAFWPIVLGIGPYRFTFPIRQSNCGRPDIDTVCIYIPHPAGVRLIVDEMLDGSQMLNKDNVAFVDAGFITATPAFDPLIPPPIEY
jgi:hypothetical protein